MIPDVLVVGAGPAALALVAACSREGLRVTGVSERVPGVWPQTYGAWLDEVDDDVPFQRTWSDVRVHAVREFRLERSYGLIDNAGLFGALTVGGSAEWRVGQVASVEHSERGSSVRLRDGRQIEARIVVDASGHRPVLVRRPSVGRTAFQTAYGIVGRFDAPPVPPHTVTWMDLRSGHLSPGDRRGPPSFLYAMHLGEDRYFVEETSLAASPPLGLDVLEARLERRLEVQGTPVGEVAHVERCVFPMTSVAPPPQRVVAFGAAAGMVHPATGFMVARALRLAPSVAAMLARELGAPGASPDRVARRAWAVVWPEDARETHGLHLFGLDALLGMSGRALEGFFATFFELPPQEWQAYLSRTAEPRHVTRMMLRLFARCGWGVRRHLTATGLRRPDVVARALRLAL